MSDVKSDDEVICEFMPEMRQFDRGYFVTRDGRIFSTRPKSGRGASTTPRELKQRVSNRGYAVVGNWRVNRAIAVAWIGPPPSARHEARHLDGDRLHNHVDNIAWGTPIENCADRKLHGTEAHNRQVLTEEAVHQLFAAAALRRWGKGRIRVVNKHELARRFGVTENQVRGIIRGRSWKYLNLNNR